jgi:hypothetical protein
MAKRPRNKSPPVAKRPGEDIKALILYCNPVGTPTIGLHEETRRY